MDSWSHYLYNLNQFIHEQDQKIHSLEKRLQHLENNTNGHQNPPVEKIEYNFDQLKIENLNGTLHIGLSPEDLNGIDDFSVPDTGKSPFRRQLAADLNNYLKENGEQLIVDIAAEKHVARDNIDPHILIEDMAKQLPERITFYENEARQNHQELSESQLKDHISEQIKQEIHQSLSKYMEGNEP
ncbi:putative spore germination protein GerPC [Lentibacillus kapialis]|uniref:Spore germination protein GerPC n=1 Tax=Lentibacillus kapialis TaxID=340214 RepID=A0A917Q260_9BACI|nr:spore germination protein GerPC [Lentibacillus kapialis]GGK07238.1 putative spore germination protein GerPC [Lentibacillus kapialis]